MSGPPQDHTRPWIAVDQTQIAPSPSPAQVVQAPVVTPSASATTAASRKRGCNCKKSGCLKLYCECFAANMRCGERCQCMGCKNKEHNRLEIAHAIQAIEKRTQKAFRSPATVARKLEQFRNTPVLAANPLAPHAAVPVLPPSSSVVLGATPLITVTTQALTTRTAITTTRLGKYARVEAGSARLSVRVLFALAGATQAARAKAASLYSSVRSLTVPSDLPVQENQSERDRAVAAILERNPLAFQPKVANGSSQHLRGCNCRKSGCMKNYCECHQAGVPCTSRCACHQCRNTEMFVSAKKMLVFKGPDDGTSMVRNKLGLDQHHHQHHQRVKNNSSSATTKRAYRKSSFDSPPQQHQLASHVYTPARAQNPSAALELLSRSAPAAPRPTSFLRATTPSKRTHAADASPYQLHQTTDRPFVSSSQATAATTNNFTKRKYSKVSSRPLFMDRIQEAAAGANYEEAALPSVEKTIEQEFDSEDTTVAEPSLATLCRSLLRAAMTVESTGTTQDNCNSDNDAQARNGKNDDNTNSNLQRRVSVEMTSEDVCMSPVTYDLLCAEDIETPGDKTGVSSSSQEDEDQHVSSSVIRDSNSARQAAKDLNLVAAAQERAVLQEVSVWLRNITTAALPNPNGSSSRQY